MPDNNKNNNNAIGTVAVLMGGLSAERKISLKSGAAVLAALQQQGVDAFALDIGENALAQLQEKPFDVAFIALHGRGGEDGAIQGLLEWMGKPYTGSNVLGSALAMDKVRCKYLWSGCGLPTPDFAMVGREDELDGVIAKTGLPVAVKPASEGSSIGVYKVTDLSELKPAFEAVRTHNAGVLVESWVEGREFTVSILGQQALPVIGLKPQGAFYDYEAKYVSGDTEYLLPSGLEAGEEAQVQQLAIAAFNAVGCRHWGRVDILQDRQGSFWLLEINTIPGMTGHSLTPKAAAAVGMSMGDLVVRILQEALA